MAARNRVGLSENTRLRIKTTMLVKRLQDHILGKVDLTQSQVRSIEVLLKKTLPDLSAIHSTEDKEKTYEDWLDALPERSSSTD